MKIDFDPNKNQENIRVGKPDFNLVNQLDFATADYAIDDRYDYGETRIKATGFIGERLYVVVYTPIAGGIRAISFRKANPREVKNYANTRN